MSRASRLGATALCTLLILLMGSLSAPAQRRAVPRHPAPPAPAVAGRGHVFIGGYFYDPFFGPYPWWHRTAYPYRYFPIFDTGAHLHIRVAPESAEEAAVYVDGFYAGVVDDFNGVFQGLPLTPGGHRITLYLAGYRTIRRNVYLSPGSIFHLRETMQPLPINETAEPPEVAPPVPSPPAGTYRTPVRPPRAPVPSSAAAASTTGVGVLDLRVEPTDIEVRIDGQPWLSADEGHFVVQLSVGKHRLELRKTGTFVLGTDVEIGDGTTNTLELRLKAAPPAS
jgi:hypothetical protein